MSQPPYPPQGGSDPGGERSGAHGWAPQGDDDPTRRLAAPAGEGQRDATRQFGPPQYGAPGEAPYGQPGYGQAPYSGYGQPQYGQPQYGQPQYGQRAYPPSGEPRYGHPQYGPPQYGPPPFGQPWGPPAGAGGQPPKKNKNTVVAVVAGAVLVLAVIGTGLVLLLRAGDPTPEPSASGLPSSATDDPSEPTGDGGIPTATVTPDGLGNDPDLDELAQECFAGDMPSCDDLYELAEPDSLYALYGGTCAGRQDVSDADTVFCTDAFRED